VKVLRTDQSEVSEDCGNPGQAAVAAFRPWRGSLAGIPQPLTAANIGCFVFFASTDPMELAEWKIQGGNFLKGGRKSHFCVEFAMRIR
jgi:hypothetical protein